MTVTNSADTSRIEYPVLATCVRLIHHGIILFVVLGWAIPSREVRLIHMIFLPLMFLHWRLNRNTCILTNLEHWLRGSTRPKEQQTGFIRGAAEKILRRELSESRVNTVIYAILVVVWLLSASLYMNS